MWYQFHAKDWGARYFEGHETVDLHNSNSRAVPLTWILLDSKSAVELVSKIKMLLNIWMVQDEDAIRVHCNIGVNIVKQIGNLIGYWTV